MASSKVTDQTSPLKPTKPTLAKDPFSEEELDKFVLRSRARVPAMIASVNQTIEDNEVSFNQRRKVQTMSLGHYETLARDHWKEFLPTRYKALKKAGTLETEIEKAAQLTDREMQAAEAAGIPRDQAWEEIRGRYLLLNPEPESEDDGPDHPGLRLIQELIDLQQAVYDSDL